jgi:hypothetical protein
MGYQCPCCNAPNYITKTWYDIHMRNNHPEYLLKCRYEMAVKAKELYSTASAVVESEPKSEFKQEHKSTQEINVSILREKQKQQLSNLENKTRCLFQLHTLLGPNSSLNEIDAEDLTTLISEIEFKQKKQTDDKTFAESEADFTEDIIMFTNDLDQLFDKSANAKEMQKK